MSSLRQSEGAVLDVGPLPAPALLGSKSRTALFILIAVLGETYPAELARYMKRSIANVQRVLDKAEEEGFIATRPRAARIVTLNPIHPAAKEFRELLLRLADGYPEYDRVRLSRRVRPRRRGKLL